MSEKHPETTKRVLLEQIAENLRPCAEIDKLRLDAVGVMQHMNKDNFRLLVKELNLVSGPGVNFSEEVFDNAQISPDLLDHREYQKFYGIAPVAVSLGILPKHWKTFQEMIGTSDEVTVISRRHLKNTAYALDRFGMSFYRVGCSDDLRHQAQLSLDSWIYGTQKDEVEGFKGLQATHPEYLNLWVEHQMMDEFVITQALDSISDEDMIKRLSAVKSRLTANIENYLFKFLGAEDPSEYKRVKTRFQQANAVLAGRIGRAVNAVVELEDLLGHNAMTTLFYTAGGKVPLEDCPYDFVEGVDKEDEDYFEKEAQQRILSPFNNLILLEKYILGPSNEPDHIISSTDLWQSIQKKGYRKSTQSPAR